MELVCRPEAIPVIGETRARGERFEAPVAAERAHLPQPQATPGHANDAVSTEMVEHVVGDDVRFIERSELGVPRKNLVPEALSEVDRTGQHVNRGAPLRRVIHTRQEDGLLITLPCCAVVSGQSVCCVGRAGWRVRAHGLVQSYDFGNELIAATPDVHDEAPCPALLAQQVAVGVRGLEASGFSSNELQAMFSQNALRILPRRT
jgi:hypothetical protein